MSGIGNRRRPAIGLAQDRRHQDRAAGTLERFGRAEQGLDRPLRLADEAGRHDRLVGRGDPAVKDRDPHQRHLLDLEIIQGQGRLPRLPQSLRRRLRQPGRDGLSGEPQACPKVACPDPARGRPLPRPWPTDGASDPSPPCQCLF